MLVIIEILLNYEIIAVELEEIVRHIITVNGIRRMVEQCGPMIIKERIRIMIVIHTDRPVLVQMEIEFKIKIGGIIQHDENQSTK